MIKMVETKEWYKSKTVWINIIALAALIAQTQTGFIISPEEQVAVIVVINLILRFITNTGLETKK